MITKEQFLGSVRHEIEVCKHLFQKLGQDQFSWRAAEGMRSLDEVLRYLTYCGVGPAEALISGDWSSVGRRAEAARAWPIAEFPAAMDRQMEEIVQRLDAYRAEDLQQKTGRLPWGDEQPLGLALVNTTLKFLAAYRMQLFLHAKQSGCSDLKTINCWLGQDAREQVQA